MKITIVTPTSAKSAIAVSTRLVVQELTRLKVQVHLISSELRDPTENLDFGLPIIRWDDVSKIKSLGKIENIVYQIGDNFDYHRGAMELMQEIPGVVILHDAYLGHLASAWNAENLGRKRSHIWGSLLKEPHPIKPVSDFRHESFEYTAGYLELISENALGIVTHSAWSTRIAGLATELPIIQQKLPWSGIASVEMPTPKTAAEFTVLTIGNINPNKKCDSVIKAIALSGKSKISYRLAGSISNEEKKRLSNLAQGLGVQISILGAISDDELHKEILNADLISNLRYPVLEGASASLLDAFSMRKAAVVVNYGHYAELPENCVFKVNKIDIENEFASLLDKVIQGEISTHPVGIAAQEYFRSSHQTTTYAEKLLSFLEGTRKFAPLVESRNRLKDIDIEWYDSLKKINQSRLGVRMPMAFLLSKLQKPTRRFLIALAGNPTISGMVKKLYKKFHFLEPLVSKMLRLIGI